MERVAPPQAAGGVGWVARKETRDAGDHGDADTRDWATGDRLEHRARNAARAERTGRLGPRDELATLAARDRPIVPAREGAAARTAQSVPRRIGLAAPARSPGARPGSA